jgi:hypothetical protein
MTASAAVVSAKLIELFDNVPEYVDYDCDEVVKDFESDYRIALGRIAKSWGDQLLDLAEHPASPLTRNETKTIDALLERISEVFEQLNTFEEVRVPADDTDRRETLRLVDGSILHAIEETASLMCGLQSKHAASLWLHDRAGKMYRRLRRLARELRRRNQVLSGDVRASHSRGRGHQHSSRSRGEPT